MYHRVLPEQHPDRRTEQPGMYVSPETLAMHLVELRRHFELVHLDDWIRAANQGLQVPHNACAVTFDDGWLDNYEHAYPLLKQFECPATIYLVSDLVGTRYEFWPNRLSELLVADDRRALPDWLSAIAEREKLLESSLPVDYIERVDAVINACKAMKSDAEMISLLDEVGLQRARKTSDLRRNLMNWTEIKEMAVGDLIRFGSHSRRHTRLSDQVSNEVTRDEIVNSAAVIERNLGSKPKTFCYPNGDYSAAALGVVRKHYEAAVTTRTGWNALHTDKHVLNRVGVHEDITNDSVGFLSRIAR